MTRVPRERLHRAKRKDTGEWVEGYYIHYRDMVHQIYACGIPTRRGESCSMFLDIDPATLGEFTSLRIKKGGKDSVKIFEDDILKVVMETPNGKEIVECYVVEFVNGLFLARKMNTNKIAGPVSNFAATKNFGGNSFVSCKIIGNIHDNPELLRKANV